VPMAISLGWGVLFATVITLFLVPSLYLILYDFTTHSAHIEDHSRIPDPAIQRGGTGSLSLRRAALYHTVDQLGLRIFDSCRQSGDSEERFPRSDTLRADPADRLVRHGTTELGHML